MSCWLEDQRGLMTRVPYDIELGEVVVRLDPRWAAWVSVSDEYGLGAVSALDDSPAKEDAYRRLRYERCPRCPEAPDPAQRTLHVIFHEDVDPEPGLPAAWHVVDGGRIARVDLAPIRGSYAYGPGLRTPWRALMVAERLLLDAARAEPDKSA